MDRGGAARAENLDGFTFDEELRLYLVVDGQSDLRSTTAALRAFVASVRAAPAEGPPARGRPRRAPRGHRIRA